MRGSSTIRNAALLRDRGLCCNCGQSADHTHHVVPLGRGGQDVLSNVVAICQDCHGLVHGFDFGTSHRALSAVGQARARAAGKAIGRPVSYSPEQVEQVQRLVAEGMSIAAAARATGLTETTARRLAKG